MPVDKAKLLASREAALAAKHAFEAAFVSDLSGCAVGLGVSPDGQHWKLKVYVQDPAAEPHLPERFEKLDVDIEMTGAVVAH